MGVKGHIHTPGKATPHVLSTVLRLEGEVSDRWVSQQAPEEEVLALLDIRNCARCDEHTGGVSWV